MKRNTRDLHSPEQHDPDLIVIDSVLKKPYPPDSEKNTNEYNDQDHAGEHIIVNPSPGGETELSTLLPNVRSFLNSLQRLWCLFAPPTQKILARG